MVARLRTIVFVALLGIVGLGGTAAAAPVLCLAEGNSATCLTGALSFDENDTFLIDLIVEPTPPTVGIDGYISFAVDSLTFDDQTLSLDDVTAGTLADNVFASFDTAGMLFASGDIVGSGLGSLLRFAFTARSGGSTALTFVPFDDLGPVLLTPETGSDVAGAPNGLSLDVEVQAAPAVVPEPATLSLMGLGLGVAAMRRRLRRIRSRAD